MPCRGVCALPPGFPTLSDRARPQAARRERPRGAPGERGVRRRSRPGRSRGRPPGRESRPGSQAGPAAGGDGGEPNEAEGVPIWSPGAPHGHARAARRPVPHFCEHGEGEGRGSGPCGAGGAVEGGPTIGLGRPKGEIGAPRRPLGEPTPCKRGASRSGPRSAGRFPARAQKRAGPERSGREPAERRRGHLLGHKGPKRSAPAVVWSGPDGAAGTCCAARVAPVVGEGLGFSCLCSVWRLSFSSVRFVPERI